ncbi:MAG TPA: SigB/SigF/SigG family RNA polymerase sigma factor [Solirubrobacteraceae bacterium]|nr:SigB/SigF/SigG family RNA polymerase sigma factor [Solirubrobacteraceae bacterium]
MAVTSRKTSSDEQLLARWCKHRDPADRERLTEMYLPLARRLARKYGRSSEPFDDLFQVASLALVKAIDRYDDSRGHGFTAYAVPTILGEMRRYFRDCGWAVHVPRGTQERALKVREAQQRLATANGRAPDVETMAQFLELDREEVLDAMHALRSYDAVSLDAPIPGGGEDAPAYLDVVGSEDNGYELGEMRATVAEAARELPDADRELLRLRYVDELTQSEIASQIGVSQMQVSRLLRGTVDRLRAVATQSA